MAKDEVPLTHDEVIQALLNLGFETAWVVVGNEITVWENPEPQPTDAELRAAL